ncbi:MAG: alpha-amylase family glycosyl hydrolase [Ignavibacteria bacterium]|nr:alpha-amylase family glycosyl hydrolase [Ignavibacteria bacterium]
MIYFRFTIIISICLSSFSFSQSIEINKRDATIWAREQSIDGKLFDFFEPNVILYLNGNAINSSVNPSDSTFTIPLILNEGLSTVIVEAGAVVSDTLRLTLGYNIRPEVYAYTNVNGRDVTLRGTVIENPDTSSLTFLWMEDINNPSSVSITNPNDILASFSLSTDAPLGEYYFDLYTYSSQGDTVKSRTFVTVDSNEIKSFDIKNDYAAWIDSAIIYEITPYIFANGNQSNNNDFNTITNKIPDFIRLGLNTIWLQPVYKTHFGGQGYDVTDYFGVRSDAGTEDDLRNLIQTAKANGLKVMFDFVPNHSSIQHPYAKNTVTYGENSHYYHFYQREFDNAPYSQHYNLHPQGFVYYFWQDLPNLNYDNPEVQKWITEAATYWVRELDIDGYRFDAVWGVNARNPDFMKQLRLAIKRIKPELLMLAEDKATRAETFDENFDAAYDWYPEEDWVSHWTWQTDYNPNANPTIFNYSNQNLRSQLLRYAITNHGNGFAPDAKVLHFMENNDQFHFITHHGLDRTKMVAALEFTLHGIPLIYNGQEIGKEGHPYEHEFIFYPGLPLDYDDIYGLFGYYQNLIKWRKILPALYRGDYEEISVSPNQYVFSFRRWKNDQNVITVLNMRSSSANAVVTLPVNEMNLDSTKTYYLTNLLEGDYIAGTPSELATLNIPMEQYSAKVYLLADSIVTGVEDIASIVPGTFDVFQNYPNPFNPSTTIKYNLPSEGKVTVKIFDVLGREVASPVNEIQQAGSHTAVFDGSKFSSGVYIYRIEFDNHSFSKKMLLLK